MCHHLNQSWPWQPARCQHGFTCALSFLPLPQQPQSCFKVLVPTWHSRFLRNKVTLLATWFLCLPGAWPRSLLLLSACRHVCLRVKNCEIGVGNGKMLIQVFKGIWHWSFAAQLRMLIALPSSGCPILGTCPVYTDTCPCGAGWKKSSSDWGPGNWASGRAPTAAREVAWVMWHVMTWV